MYVFSCYSHGLDYLPYYVIFFATVEVVVEVVTEVEIVEETMEALVQIGILMVETVLVHTENF